MASTPPAPTPTRTPTPTRACSGTATGWSCPPTWSSTCPRRPSTWRACDQVAAGGYLYLQTPDAHHIDLARPASVRQVLQQPHHRHLVTAAWLAERLGPPGFEPVARPHRPYLHTRIPFLNLPTLDDYLERNGGLVALNEPFRWSSLRRPGFWWRGLTGGFVNGTDEVQLIFCRAG